MPPISAILAAVASCPAVRSTSATLPTPGERSVLGGTIGSLAPAVVAALHRAHPDRVFIAVADSPGAALAAEADLEAVVDGIEESYLYPQKEALPYEETEPHLEIGGLRVEAVEALFSGRAKIVVTTPRALQERVPIPTRLAKLRQTLRVGDEVAFLGLGRSLEARGFERVALVEEVGQFAVRGGILDVFSVAAGEPVRIEFWGDEIVSIRSFEILDQRSTAELTDTHILPVDFRRGADDGADTVSTSLVELLPGDAIIVRLGTWDLRAEFERTWDRVTTLYHSLIESGASPSAPEALFVPPKELAGLLSSRPRLDLVEETDVRPAIDARPVPSVNRDMARLESYLREGAARGEETLLLCDNDGQLQRMEEILGGAGRLPPGSRLGLGALASGFELACSDPPLRVLNDHEIFRRARRVRRGRRFRGAVALESLAQLTPGDYVVHMDHGVGRFTGLEHIRVGGQELEALAIEYGGGEILRLPVSRLDLVERWVGESDDSKPPRIHRIGGKRWKTLRRKTEKVIEETTIELLELYAHRQTAVGYAFAGAPA